MAETKKRRQLKTFPGLADRFQHPDDLAATAALQAMPGLDTLVAKVMEYGFERVYYLENIADNVRVTPAMFPRLHRCLGLGLQDPRRRGAGAVRHAGPGRRTRTPTGTRARSSC